MQSSSAPGFFRCGGNCWRRKRLEPEGTHAAKSEYSDSVDVASREPWLEVRLQSLHKALQIPRRHEPDALGKDLAVLVREDVA